MIEFFKDPFVLSYAQYVYLAIGLGMLVSLLFLAAFKGLSSSSIISSALTISEFSFKAERVTSSLISHEIEDQGNVLAPMHGVIKEIFVSNGDKVEKGQIIFILEAMKMQHEVSATGTGLVSEVNVNEGDQVEAEQQLLNIEMEE